ncbi:MAG: hypothetical protein L0G22_11510, partial [Propionibacteriaceae bacterium]|nr:hypothetical protein [Propionibacteriaceae bacterium]
MSDHDLPPLRRPGPGRDVPRGNGSDDNGPGGSGPGDNGPDDSGPGRATLGRTPRPPYDPSVVVALSLSSPSFLTPA